jgi:DNA-binding NarL/FixJ family response regulator
MLKRAKNTTPARPSRKPLRVLLVDDHAMLLDALRRQFEADKAFRVVATAGTLAEVRAAMTTHRPDVVLLDIQLGSESGLDAITCIRAVRSDTKIVMISMFEQEIYRDRAFKLGADAYVTKGACFAELLALLQGEFSGDRLSGGAVRIWLNSDRARTERQTLTARELRVVNLLSEGKREKEVADELNISPSSVGTYLKRAMQKAGMTTRAELFRHAGSLGVHTASDESQG